jgi:putative ubiquitin-RnfH superfamily antitoxin RatB of RatAB toxin-antitoxin module
METSPKAAAADTLDITIVFAKAVREVVELEMRVRAGICVADAVALSGVLGGLSATEVDALLLAIWGRKVSPHQQLRQGDRVEILRTLKVDPKVARRERFVKQGAKAAGLFSQRRAGGKAGY